jgi:ribonucleoside-triphosphate reductase
LRSSTKNEYFNQFGAGGTKIGSLGVVTLNIPRIAIKANGNIDNFTELLTDLVETGIKINNTKRFLLKKRISSKSLPLYELGFMSLDTQYSTIGVTGLNEACEFMGLNILNQDGQDFIIKLLDTINTLNDKAAKKYNSPHNLEQTPSENSAIKMAAKDKLLGYQDKFELYSNQFIPLTTRADILDRIKLQGMFDSKMSGGAICHLNIETKIEDYTLIENLIKVSAKAGVVYTAINYNIQRCINEHLTVGKNENCSICNGEITDNFSRVVGFLVNTKNFHKTRREIDYPNRVWYGDLSV